MKSRTPNARINDRNFLWLVCIVALCAGFYVACIRFEMRIAATKSDERQSVASVAADARIVAQRPQLERVAFELDQQLQKVYLRADHPTIVAHLITACARIALLHHTRVVQIDERRADPALLPPATLAPDDVDLEKIPIDITLSGSYRDLLLAIRDFIEAPVATSVDVAAIERGTFNDANTLQPALVAHLHVTLVRLLSHTITLPVDAAPSEMLHARSL